MAIGDIIYRDSSLWKRLAANGTGTNKFLRSVSSGAPSWELLAAGDIPVTSIVATTTSTGSVNNYAPGALTNLVRCNNATNLTITGIVAGYDGQMMSFVSIGAGRVLFSNLDGGSSAANQLVLPVTGLNLTLLAPGLGFATFQYDATSQKWRLIHHEQGASITLTPFWRGSVTDPTIGNGTIATYYYLRGCKIQYVFTLNMGSTTTFGSGFWQFPLSGSIIAAATPVCAMFCYDNSSGTPGQQAIGTYSSAAATGIIGFDSTGNNIDATHPFTWAVNDILRFSVEIDVS
jgi:hypothetical protein